MSALSTLSHCLSDVYSTPQLFRWSDLSVLQSKPVAVQLPTLNSQVWAQVNNLSLSLSLSSIPVSVSVSIYYIYTLIEDWRRNWGAQSKNKITVFDQIKSVCYSSLSASRTEKKAEKGETESDQDAIFGIYSTFWAWVESPWDQSSWKRGLNFPGSQIFQA